MAFEKGEPISEGNKSSAENLELKKELGFLDAALENIIGGKEVDFEKELSKVTSLLGSLENKFQKDEKVIKKIHKWQNRITMIAYGLGAFVAYQAGYVPGNFVSGAAVSTGMVGLNWINENRKDRALALRIDRLEADIREVKTEARNFADAYFVSGGALKEGGIYHLTEEQKVQAKSEMERDISKWRNRTDSYLTREGAARDDKGILRVTDEQLKYAKEEMRDEKKG